MGCQPCRGSAPGCAPRHAYPQRCYVHAVVLKLQVDAGLVLGALGASGELKLSVRLARLLRRSSSLARVRASCGCARRRYSCWASSSTLGPTSTPSAHSSVCGQGFSVSSVTSGAGEPVGFADQNKKHFQPNIFKLGKVLPFQWRKPFLSGGLTRESASARLTPSTPSTPWCLCLGLSIMQAGRAAGAARRAMLFLH